MTNEQEYLSPDYERFFDFLIDTFGESFNVSNKEIDEKVRALPYDGNEWLYETFVYFFLDRETADYYRYDNHVIDDKEYTDMLKWYSDRLDSDYYRAVYYFFVGDIDKCLDYISKDIIEKDIEEEPYDESDIAIDYVGIYKNAVPGFWNRLAKVFAKVHCVPYMQELLEAIGCFYESEDGTAVRDRLINVGRNIPDGYLVNELLAACYEEDKMWKNASAYYSMVKERALLRWDTLYFKTAWAASKSKDHEKALKYYEMCMGVKKDYPYAMNNYGYELYLCRRFDEAKKVFEELLDDEKLQEVNGIGFICNNYAKVLLAMKQYDAVNDFAGRSPKKLSKDILERIDKINNPSEDEKDIPELIEELPEDVSQKNRQVTAKHTQFSTEKLLEDELEVRLLHGDSVFGVKLKMYDHDNDLYGRQYVIPVGRLDLLCEDEEGNYWIVELKKDSGYDDAFAQTMEYIKWFEENKAKTDNKKVYGIICLNGPDAELIEKVRKEPRIKLFEYSISYNEIK